MSSAFDDVLDPKTAGKADRGVSARRKAELSSYEAPVDTLAANGVSVPHETFRPDEASEYPTTVEIDDVRVSLHQDVREDHDDPFGDFGNADDDTEDVVWTVVNLEDETVTITVVGQWKKRRDVPFEDFPEEYEPITCDTSQGTVPRFGY